MKKHATRTPLYEAGRNTIVSRVLAWAYEKHDKPDTKEQDKLCQDVLLYAAGGDKNLLVRINKLPDGWVKNSTTISARSARGYAISLKSSKPMRIPFAANHYNGIQIKDQALNDRLEAWATKLEKDKETRKNLSNQVRSLAKSCRTVEAFIDQMPETAELLKDMLGAASANPLVPVAATISATIAELRAAA